MARRDIRSLQYAVVCQTLRRAHTVAAPATTAYIVLYVHAEHYLLIRCQVSQASFQFADLHAVFPLVVNPSAERQ